MHRERLLRIMRWMQEARDIRKIGAWKQRLTNPDHGSGIWPRWSELHRNSSISGGFEMNLVLQTSNIPRNLSEIRSKFVHFSWDWIFFSQLNPKTLTQMIYARPIFIDKVQPRPTSLEYDYRCSSPILQHRSHRVPAICCLPIRTFRNVIMVATAVLFSYLWRAQATQVQHKLYTLALIQLQVQT